MGRRPGPVDPVALLRFGRDFQRTPTEALVRARERYGDVFFLGPPGRLGMVFLLGAEANEFVFRNPSLFSWRGGYRMLRPVSGETALLVSDGEGHRRRRAITQPAFQKARIDGYVDVMLRNAAVVVDAWRVGQPVRLYDAFRAAIRRTTVEAFFGPVLAADADRLGRDLGPALGLLNAPFARQLALQAVPNPVRRRARAGLAGVDERVFAEIARRRRAAEPGEDLLGMLLAAGEPEGGRLTPAELRDAVVSLVVASYDTTSAALGWAVYAALVTPGVWERARAEVAEVFGDGPVTAAGARRLRYLGWVVDETLRLYPPAIVGGRTAVADFGFAGHRVRTGSYVIFSQYVTHTDPRRWADPYRFLPERWDRERPGYRAPSPYEYLPFGTGFRRCVGAPLATAEVVATLALLVRRTDLRLVSAPERPAGLTAMYPSGGVAVRVEAVRPDGAVRSDGAR
ncbi:hypothetical protein SAMN05421810_101693 [Amycolatopsis arida]|uniref:Cytochrome P450 n=1 Tax=Amycolatopsis arida TaxID=587909 RepID=A0A1I5LW72_9PSEU|nr:cytochrome P450 [Amycolatopsis arida]TDX93869.1 hypothetical protein CLV69_104326 [Amycolatopsis arida]SFP01387.1 hypothetical protein SAMN05421810_101693 [Amycolatopsis arida]